VQNSVGNIEIRLNTFPDKYKKVDYEPEISARLQKFIDIMKIIAGKYCRTHQGSNRSHDQIGNRDPECQKQPEDE
jgi:hypothetical protein